jgi:DNA-binding MarR family transcriptional regulator
MSKLSQLLKSDVKLAPSKELILNLICTSNYITEKNNLFFKQYDISAPQYNVLRILRGQMMKPINLSSIQERMVHKNSNAGRLIDKLLIKGLVERNICEENRRKIEIKITSNGISLLNQIDPSLDELESNSLSNLSNSEISLLNKLLEKIRVS